MPSRNASRRPSALKDDSNAEITRYIYIVSNIWFKNELFHLYRKLIMIIWYICIYRLEVATNNGDVSWMEKDNPNYYINDMIKGKPKIQYSNHKS